MVAYIKTLLMDIFWSTGTTARWNQAIRAVPSRITDSASRSVGRRIGVGPCVGEHTCSAGTRPHGGRWLRAGRDLTTALHLAVKMYTGAVVSCICTWTVHSHVAASVWQIHQWHNGGTVGSTKRLGKTARHQWIFRISGMHTAGNTMRLNRHGIFKRCRHCFVAFGQPLHDGAENIRR